MQTTYEDERSAGRDAGTSLLDYQDDPGAGSGLPYDNGVRVGGDQALGWFSIALGATQLAAPAALGRAIGTGDGPTARLLMRLVGLRELAAGVGLLRGQSSKPWLWSRAAGDLMDLALLGVAYATTTKRRDRRRLRGALLAVTGVAALDYTTARRASVAESQGRTGAAAGESDEVELSAAVTIARPEAEVYAFWRDLRNLGRFMTSVQSVEIIDRTRSLWTVKVGGKSLSWEARITSDQVNQAIAWEALDDTVVAHRGVVQFLPAPGGRGTEVRVELQVVPPGGAAGRAVARLGRGIPRQQVINDLRRLKQVIEVGEIIKSDASVHGAPHAARPPELEAQDDDDSASLDPGYVSITVEGGAR